MESCTRRVMGGEEVMVGHYNTTIAISMKLTLSSIMTQLRLLFPQVCELGYVPDSDFKKIKELNTSDTNRDIFFN